MESKDWVQEEKVSQVVLLITMCNWVLSVEIAFGKMQAKNKKGMDEEFDREVVELTNLIKLVQGKLEKRMRTRIMCMITMDTAGRDKTEKLRLEKVSSPEEFQLEMALKPYFKDEQQDFQFYICDARLWYTYEYLGNGPRLVVTPLTDRI